MGATAITGATTPSSAPGPSPRPAHAKLKGRKPFGGHVLSHDFVEAALIRRAGWAVYMLPALTGSYEETPPCLIDLATRDRRWAQGNLQHMKIVGAKGLHWVNRVHLVQGIMSYLASPLWLMLLLAGLLLATVARHTTPNYFPDSFSLFPVLAGVRPRTGAQALCHHLRRALPAEAPRPRVGLEGWRTAPWLWRHHRAPQERAG
ncbi:MAG: glycosyltransferase family 2 protein [Hyphomicrobiales bacterium]